MLEYIREIKIQLRDKYNLKPSRIVDGEPCFDNIEDGIYPMVINGTLDNVQFKDNKIYCCR